MYQEMKKLSNGVEIPVLALGTWFIDDDKVEEAVKSAVKLGYRHIDTAQAYGNEQGVGKGIRSCGVPREQIFVTSKIAAEYKTYEEAAASIDRSLANMGLDYIDMMIIHSPQPWDKVNQSEAAQLTLNEDAYDFSDIGIVQSRSQYSLYALFSPIVNQPKEETKSDFEEEGNETTVTEEEQEQKEETDDNSKK